MASRYSPDQIRALTQAVRGSGVAECPECSVRMDQRPIPPRRDVSYVRDRIWLNCPSCHNTLVVDREDRG